MGDLEATAAAVEAIAGQTRVRLAGGVPDGSTRVVSLHNGDARPIAEGRLGRPVEFGYKAQVADNSDGVVVDYLVVKGNPADAPMLAPAIARIAKRAGRMPKAVTADRGYGEVGVDAELEAMGVGRACIPRKGKPGAARRAVQTGRGFRRLVKWGTGSEARISCLKRDFGWRRTLSDGLGGAQTWCGWGVMAHNSIKVARLIDTKNNKAPVAHEPISRPAGSSPPTPPPAVSRPAACRSTPPEPRRGFPRRARTVRKDPKGGPREPKSGGAQTHTAPRQPIRKDRPVDGQVFSGGSS